MVVLMIDGGGWGRGFQCTSSPPIADRTRKPIRHAHARTNSIQQALGLLLAGELFSLEGLQKHRCVRMRGCMHASMRCRSY